MAETMEIPDLSFLLEHEREMILRVLHKDEELRKAEERRIWKLKNELLEVRRRGSKRAQEQGRRQCRHCRKGLGLVFRRGATCQQCLQDVCRDCRTAAVGGGWRCTACARISGLKVVTGEWFLEQRSKRFSEGNMLSSDLIKQSILNSPAGDSSFESGHIQSDLRAVNKVDPPIPEMGELRIPTGDSGVAVPNDARPRTPSPSSCTKGEESAVRSDPGPFPTKPSDAESVANSHSDGSVPDVQEAVLCGGVSGTGAMAMHRASVSSDSSRSEVSQSTFLLEPNDWPSFSRRGSVPGELHETGHSDCRRDEDMDTLLSAEMAPYSSLTSASSMSSLYSTTSLYSETGESGLASVSGEIRFRITYSYETGLLNVLVGECRNLATGDERRQHTDPYVKAYLLPDNSRQSKRKTSVRSNTTSPVFNQTLKYVIGRSQLETRTLQLSVWHSGRFGHNRFLGQVEVAFDSWDFENQTEEWLPLQANTDSGVETTQPYVGELTVVLKYVPAERNLQPLDQVKGKRGFLKGKKTSFKTSKGGILELLVKEAKNLSASRSGGTSETFVKGYLLPDNSKSTKHKTAVVKRSVNAQWNHTFSYSGLQPGDLNQVCLELTIWDKEPLSSNVFLGGVRLGAGTGQSYGKQVDWMDSDREEQQLWQRMIDNPEVPQECTVVLRSNMFRRKQ